MMLRLLPGMGDHMQRTIALYLLTAVVIAATPGYAQTPDRTITCTAILIDVAMRPKVWALAVIYDAAGGYTCTVDRSASRHDPMKPCAMGDMCHLVGTYGRKVDTNYFIEHISTVDKVEEQLFRFLRGMSFCTRNPTSTAKQGQECLD